MLAREQREQLVDILFEDFHMERVFLTSDAQMCMQAVGKHTGILIDMGADTIYIVPVYEDLVVCHLLMENILI